MAVWNALGAGGRVASLVLGAIGVGAVGYLGWQVTRPVVAPEAPPEAAVESATPPADMPAIADTAPVADAGATVAAPQPPVPPQFDTWRVTNDGEAVVSGRAAPGALVSVIVDGAPVAEVRATAAGEFAALFTLPPNDTPSLMSLTMILPDGAAVPSDQTVALGVINGPVVNAIEAAPEIATALDPGTSPETAAETAADTIPEPAPAAVPETALDAPPELAPDAAADTAADTAPAAILLTDEGALVLQGPAKPDPTVLANVSIDTIAYTPEGAVQLGGRGQAGAVLRIYLDNAPVLSVQVPEGGQWLTTLGDTAPGIYTLRVDQIDAAGKVTSRFETPFKRETLEALATSAGDASTAPAVADPPAPDAVTAQPPAPDPAPSETTTTPRVTEAAPELAAPNDDAADPAPAATTTETAEARPLQSGETTTSAPVTITVQPGFTLWGIAKATMGEGVMYVQVFEANKDKIKDPDLIYPGQVFSMPQGEGDGD
jgi:LysM domain